MDDKKKNLLVIGNGFDLYHGLPTRFSDFFEFIDFFDAIYKKYCKNGKKVINNDKFSKFDSYNIALSFEEMIMEGYIHKESMKLMAKLLNRLNGYKFENGLFEYWRFLKIKEENYIENMTWNDFELMLVDILRYIKIYSEHEFVVERKLFEPKYRVEKYGEIQKLYINKIANDNKINISDKEGKVLELILKDLINFKKAFNLYIEEIVNKISVKNGSADLCWLMMNSKLSILSFNYTDYSKYSEMINWYDNIEYVHGKGKTKNDADKYKKDDIVVGISDDVFNDVKYIEFQKFFQRIMQKNANIGNRDIKLYDDVYIFGHSLCKNDSTVLKMFFDHAGIGHKTIIYYIDNKDKKSKIQNIVGWYDKELFINKISNKYIDFVELKSPKLLNIIFV